MNELVRFLREIQGFLVCAALIIGGIQCFFGYPLFRVVTAIIGFLVGGVIGGLMGFLMTGDMGFAFLGFLILGILGALLAYTLYKLGVFISCFGSGAIVGLVLILLTESDSDLIVPMMAIVGIIFGIVGVILTKPVIIISTAFSGGAFIGSALALLGEPNLGIVLGLLMAVAGVFAQFYMTRGKTAGSRAVNGRTADSGAVSSGTTDTVGHANTPSVSTPGSPLKMNEVKLLAKDDLLSRQAICGAVIYGLLALSESVILLPLWLLGILVAVWGLCTGACANRKGVDYFVFSGDVFKTPRVIISAVICGAYGIFRASFHYRLSDKIPVFLFALIFGILFGYILETRKRYRAACGDDLPAGASFAAPAAPARAAGVAGQTVLVQDTSLLWTPGLPLAVTGSGIVTRPEDPSQVALSLTFQNISEQAVIAVYFSVRCFDLLKQELESVDKLVVQDIVIESGKTWTSPRPFAIPSSDTRRIEIIVNHVVLQDGTIWNNPTGGALTPLPKLLPLGLPRDLASEMETLCKERLKRRDFARLWKYQPQRTDQYWICACGQLNVGRVCLKCGIYQRAVLEMTDPQYLADQRENRQSGVRPGANR